MIRSDVDKAPPYHSRTLENSQGSRPFKGSDEYSPQFDVANHVVSPVAINREL